MELAGVSLFAVGFVGVFAWNIYCPRFLAHVYATDSTTWSNLGEPRHRWFGYVPTAKFMSFLYKRSYESLGDATAVAFARRARTALLFAYAGAGGAVLLLGLSTWLRA